MWLPSLFKTYKNRQFTYKPIFYDQVKDELKERIKKVEGKLSGSKDGNYRIGITRGSIHRHSRLKAKSHARSKIHLAIITLILLGIAWYLLYK
jgi:hypothetical protein